MSFLLALILGQVAGSFIGLDASVSVPLLHCSVSDELVENSANFSIPVQIAALKATVRITDLLGSSSRSRRYSYGSGTLVGRDQNSIYILTASHVVDPGNRIGIHVFWRDGRQSKSIPTRKEVVIRARGPDLAILRLWTTDPMPGMLPICPPELAPLGAGGGSGRSPSSLHAREVPSLSVGCDHGDFPFCWTAWTIGHAYRQTNYSRSYFTITDREPVSGRSGGPLVNTDGYVIGVCIAGGDGQGIFATLSEIHKLCDTAGLEELYRMWNRKENPKSEIRNPKSEQSAFRVPHSQEPCRPPGGG